VIRPFEAGDAEQAAALVHALSPWTLDAASLLHRQASEPERSRRRSWVAVAGGEVVGYASAHFQWFGGESGKGRVWVGVRPDRRSHGIGTALWDAAVERLAGARSLTVAVDDDPAGLAFVERRGFTPCGEEVVSSLDPRACTVDAEAPGGEGVASLRAVRERERELFAFYEAAGGIPAGDPGNRVTFEEWTRVILESPLLSDDGSVVVLDADGRIVSLAWLLVDAHGRGENEWTATLPELRGRGLARLAKVASTRWAAGHGVTEIVTGNAPENEPMRALNRRLGYRELFLRRELERLL
jgi:GNAT superfamily N-acetyltransferase